jgi:predicted nuclease of predicted toxin-antitoxin system
LTRLLIDRNLTPRWVGYLVDANFECAHWSSIGPVTAQDVTICAYARENGFAIITNDLDFPQILAHTSESKPSIILLRGEPLIPELRRNCGIECHRMMPQRTSIRASPDNRLVSQDSRTPVASLILECGPRPSGNDGNLRGAWP